MGPRSARLFDPLFAVPACRTACGEALRCVAMAMPVGGARRLPLTLCVGGLGRWARRHDYRPRRWVLQEEIASGYN